MLYAAYRELTFMFNSIKLANNDILLGAGALFMNSYLKCRIIIVNRIQECAEANQWRIIP